jgi:hypothetical protein
MLHLAKYSSTCVLLYAVCSGNQAGMRVFRWQECASESKSSNCSIMLGLETWSTHLPDEQHNSAIAMPVAL